MSAPTNTVRLFRRENTGMSGQGMVLRKMMKSMPEGSMGNQGGPRSGKVIMALFYWSSTTNANNTNNAWGMNFNNGNDNNNNKSNNNHVRAVRGGKCSLLSFRSVHDAYMDCRKRKRGTINAVGFEYDLIGNLTDLVRELQKGTYRPSRSVCFITSSPKLREVFAADFRDRIVHHLIVRELEPVYESCFIHDSYASRKNKGIHKAVKRLQRFMLKATRNRNRPAWFMQLDIRSFFMSIDKRILFELVCKKTGSPELLWLVHTVIFHDCTRDYVFKGDPGMLAKIPAHKSLFKIPPGKGLPIGNLTSQFFANVYLNELDQFVKHRLRCRFYVRYVDDFVLLSDSREQLPAWRKQIIGFLKDRLCLTLRSDGIIQRVSDGSDFLGYIVRPDYLLSRRRVVNNLKHRLTLFREKIACGMMVRSRPVEKMTLTPEIISEIRQVLASYLGHFKHADTRRLIKSLFDRHAWLNILFLLKNGKLVERLRYRGTFRSFRAQEAFFRFRFPGDVLFFQMGKYIEVFGADALLFNRVFGMALRKNARRMDHAAGFPAWREKSFLEQTLLAGFNVVRIREGMAGPYVRERYVYEIYTIARGLSGAAVLENNTKSLNCRDDSGRKIAKGVCR